MINAHVKNSNDMGQEHLTMSTIINGPSSWVVILLTTILMHLEGV